MKLDVIIPTYNRAYLLSLAVKSLFDAKVPSGLSVRIFIVDNNSTDATKSAVEGLQRKYGERLRYVCEKVQGRAAALNRGIVETDGALIGMVDDDEEVDRDWYSVVHKIFSERPEISFIGGPYLPDRQVRFPPWLPGAAYRGVIGWMQEGDGERFFDARGGILLGGNAVVRRELYQRVGLYNVHLGRTKSRLMSMEDQDMYERFLNAGAKGLYTPKLVIYHHISEERLTKAYHRRWCFWTGVSVGIRERLKPSNVAKIARMPRYMIRKTIASAFGAVFAALTGKQPSIAFSKELDVLTFAGMVVGLYFWKLAKGETESPTAFRDESVKAVSSARGS